MTPEVVGVAVATSILPSPFKSAIASDPIERSLRPSATGEAKPAAGVPFTVWDRSFDALGAYVESPP